jgi:hypothetical protein
MTLFSELTMPPDYDFRKDMMRVMAEVSHNPANVVPERQEELASFMVQELKAHHEEVTVESEKWVPQLLF